jgi:hypothetical protein
VQRLVAAAAGGRILADAGAESQIRAAISAFGLEIGSLATATLSAIGYKSASSSPVLQLYALIGLTAVVMGMRNAAVRKLGVPDLTTTVLTLTITGLAADSSLAQFHGRRPQLWTGRTLDVTRQTVSVTSFLHNIFVHAASFCGR